MIYPYQLLNQVDTSINKKSDNLTKSKKDKWTPSKTALASLVLPGSGQVINSQWYKAPFFYAAFIGIGYLIVTNDTKYARYRDAYRIRTGTDSTKLDEFNPKNPNVSQANYVYNASQLLTYREDYKSNRDMSILLGVVVYAANVIDAYVYSHLKNFSISDDLSLKINPIKFEYNAVRNDINFNTGIAIQLK